jgi:hypothetical protein
MIATKHCCVVSHVELDCAVAFKAYITAVHRAANCLTSGTSIIPNGTITSLLQI